MFWRLVEEAKSQSGGDPDRQVEILEQKLSQLSTREVIRFDQILSELESRSYTWDLWAAATIINGGCSDDGFDYFRGWLIAQGQRVFEAALRDPETLGDVAGFDEAELESMLYVALEVYEAKTGEEMPTRMRSGPAEPAGEPWKEEDLPQKFPRLWAKFVK